MPIEPSAPQPRPTVIAVAVSGGRDSTALLHATVRAATPLGIEVLALHVHHGLMAEADAWLEHLQRQCRRWRSRGAPLALTFERLLTQPAPGDSVEAWARRERYRALRRMALAHGASLVLLAHHRRDQAETVLLQALRGAGPAGLAAMPRCATRDGITWARPWLDVPSDAIDAYVSRWRLSHIDDPSNHAHRHARSRLRSAAWRALSAQFPELESGLVHAARRAQEADAALSELALLDLDGSAAKPTGLDIAALRALSDARRANLLRHWIKRESRCGASDALISRLVAQSTAAAGAARWPAPVGTVSRYRGTLSWSPATLAGAARPPQAEPAVVTMDLHQPGDYRLPGWAGVLAVRTVPVGGVPAALLKACTVRARQGGEQFQLTASGIARSLKKQFQALGVAAWQRAGPMLYSGDDLLFVPALGIDARRIASGKAAQRTLQWLPD